MKNLKILVTFLMCVSLWTNSQGQDTQHYNSLDTVDEIIQGYFDRISGPAERENWTSFKTLFLPTTQFNAIGINENGENEYYPQTLNEFIRHLQDYTTNYGFFQNCLDRSKITYGRIAQVNCVYESRNAPSGEVIERGLISFHAVQNEGRWWIASVLWNSETKQNPLPDNILTNN